MASKLGSGFQQRLCRQRGPLHIDCKAVIAEQVQVEEYHIPLHEEYDIMEHVGQGSTGVVYHAKRKMDGKDVALKTMRKSDIELTASMKREYTILLSIEHPNIIQAFDFFESDKRFVLVLEFFSGPSLEDTVRRAPERCLGERVAKELFCILLQAVDYLHQRRIVHRDVKANNVLVSRDLARLKLVDFNTARQLMEGGALTMTGTLQYMAPEVLKGESPSESGDVWAAGMCLYFMLSGRLPQGRDRFSTVAEFSGAAAVRPVSFRGEPWGRATGLCTDFLRQCLCVEKALRPAPMTLLEHAWFKSGGGAGAASKPPSRSVSCPSQSDRPARHGPGHGTGPFVG